MCSSSRRCWQACVCVLCEVSGETGDRHIDTWQVACFTPTYPPTPSLHTYSHPPCIPTHTLPAYLLTSTCTSLITPIHTTHPSCLPTRTHTRLTPSLHTYLYPHTPHTIIAYVIMPTHTPSFLHTFSHPHTPHTLLAYLLQHIHTPHLTPSLHT
jgi:hypothetical protein